MPEAVITELNSDAVESLADEAVKQAIAESEPEQPRDEKGKFKTKAEEIAEEVSSEQVKELDPSVPDEAEPEVPEEIKLPEGMVAVPKVEGRELAAPFKILDKDGELEVPDLTIEFQANGKTRKEPLDKVVKLAQFGVYNHEREQAVAKSQEDARAIQDQNRQVTDYARQLESKLTGMLENPDLYLAELKQFEARNTPQARAEAQKQENERLQAQVKFQEQSRTGSDFARSEITPAVESIRKALPTVSEEEIGAKLLLITNQYVEHTPFGTIVPQSAYPAIRKAVLEQVVPWAQQLHESRDFESRTEREKREKETKAAQLEAQKAKNLVGRVTKPGGSGKAQTKESKPAKPIKTIEDAEESVLKETMAAMGFDG